MEEQEMNKKQIKDEKKTKRYIGLNRMDEYVIIIWKTERRRAE